MLTHQLPPVTTLPRQQCIRGAL
jgi:hypothetical protein